MFVLKLFFLSSRPPQKMGNNPEDFDRQAEMSVRVRKGGFMIETLGHWNIHPNVVLKTLELFISSVPSSTEGHGRPREAPWSQREATVRAHRFRPGSTNLVLYQSRKDL